MPRLSKFQATVDTALASTSAARKVYDNGSFLENNNDWWSTTYLTPRRAHNPSSLSQPKYRHRRPRANFDCPNIHELTDHYRSPQRSHKGRELTIHVGSDSETRLAEDSDGHIVRRNSDGHGQDDLYEEWTNLPYPDEPRPKDSSPRQHQRRHPNTQRTKSGSPVRAPKPTTPVEIKPTSPFTSEDEGIDFKHPQMNQIDRPDKRVKSQTQTRLERQDIRRGLRFLRAQCLALESDLFYTDPGLLNADVVEKLRKTWTAWLICSRALRLGITGRLVREKRRRHRL